MALYRGEKTGIQTEELRLIGKLLLAYLHSTPWNEAMLQHLPVCAMLNDSRYNILRVIPPLRLLTRLFRCELHRQHLIIPIMQLYRANAVNEHLQRAIRDAYVVVAFHVRYFDAREPLVQPASVILYILCRNHTYLDHSTSNLPWDDQANGKPMIRFQRLAIHSPSYRSRVCQIVFHHKLCLSEQIPMSIPFILSAAQLRR